MCRSTNHPRDAEPEVWFRILDVTQERRDDVPVAPYREQPVEIALGPKGAFGSANIAALSRRVAADLVVSVAPVRHGMPKPPRAPRTPRVVELLRKAIAWQTLLESGEVTNQAAIAAREGITRARVTQVMGMLRVSPEIQQHILSMPDMARLPVITERALRPIAQLKKPADQKARLEKLLEKSAHRKL